MHARINLGIIILLFLAVSSQAQGTLRWTVTFEGPPYLDRDSGRAVTSYSELGMEFRPIANGQFGRSGGGDNVAFPDNGTAYLNGAYTYSLSVTAIGGARFGVVSVDLAEFSTFYQSPLTVHFIGYRLDGSTVETSFVTDGIIDGQGPLADFQTFYFDTRFADLTKLEIPTVVTTTGAWALDNMVFSSIPEPSTLTLLAAGGLLLFAGSSRRRKWHKVQQ